MKTNYRLIILKIIEVVFFALLIIMFFIGAGEFGKTQNKSIKLEKNK